MPRIDLVREVAVSKSARAQQLSAIFDVPWQDTQRVEWHGDVPIESEPWSVGLIVGPSGTGKTQVGTAMFGDPLRFTWNADSMIDDFPAAVSIDAVTKACSAVGLNTIPAWLRPFTVLSVGEQFRATVARALVAGGDPLFVDEFTSVVDRQVAKITAHAVQKYVRRHRMRFVAASCHYDITDWLQPDWVFEPASWSFTRRHPQPRPPLDGHIAEVSYEAWRLFAPFHYLTASLHRAARLFCLFVAEQPTALVAVLYRPSVTGTRPIWASSRLVCLPDWQGLGLAHVLSDRLAGLYAAQGQDYRRYPAHPALIRAIQANPKWERVKAPGAAAKRVALTGGLGWRGGRPCAVFRYAGPPGDRAESIALLGDLSRFQVTLSRRRVGGMSARPESRSTARPVGRGSRRLT